MVTDLMFPVGVVGLDEHTRGGSLIIQHYLTGTPSEHAPLMWLNAERDEPWFGRYLVQCEACADRAREWAGPVSDPGPALDYVFAVRRFFDRQYAAHERYRRRDENRYSTDQAVHTEFNAALLRVAAWRGPGTALDLGAGEGADAIRLAKLGYHVDAVEMSTVACEKIERFARSEGVRVRIRNEPAEITDLAGADYDLVLMSGSLHYIRDKQHVLHRVLAASAEDAVHAVSLFSTATPVPDEHAVIPVCPDDEGGAVEHFYQGWKTLYHVYEQRTKERARAGRWPRPFRTPARVAWRWAARRVRSGK